MCSPNYFTYMYTVYMYYANMFSVCGIELHTNFNLVMVSWYKG